MHVQTVTVSAKGVHGLCEACGCQKQVIEISVKGSSKDRGVRVCTSCLSSPGISFKAPVTTDDTQVLSRKRIMKTIKRGEKATAKEVAGKTTFASGAVFGDGDVTNEDWMIEEKRWTGGDIPMKINDVTKAAAQAQRQRKDWVFRIRLPTLRQTLAVMNWDSAVDLIRGDS